MSGDSPWRFATGSFDKGFRLFEGSNIENGGTGRLFRVAAAYAASFTIELSLAPRRGGWRIKSSCLLLCTDRSSGSTSLADEWVSLIGTLSLLPPEVVDATAISAGCSLAKEPALADVVYRYDGIGIGIGGRTSLLASLGNELRSLLRRELSLLGRFRPSRDSKNTSLENDWSSSFDCASEGNVAGGMPPLNVVWPVNRKDLRLSCSSSDSSLEADWLNPRSRCTLLNSKANRLIGRTLLVLCVADEDNDATFTPGRLTTLWCELIS